MIHLVIFFKSPPDSKIPPYHYNIHPALVEVAVLTKTPVVKWTHSPLVSEDRFISRFKIAVYYYKPGTATKRPPEDQRCTQPLFRK